MSVGRTIATSLVFLLSTATSQLVTTAAEAQDDRERGSISIGAFITDRRSSTRLDSDNGSGTDLDLEGDLGLETSATVARLGGHYWFSPRQRIDVSLFDLSRSSSKVIEETIDFGDETFEIDTLLAVQSDLTIAKAAYTFAPIVSDRGYLGFTAGLYIAETSLTLSEAALGTRESGDLTAPLPVIGLRGDYEISDRFTLRGAGEWFKVDTGDAEGSLRDIYIGIDYGFNERAYVGLAYNDVEMNISASDDSGSHGILDWGYDGYLLYFRYEFQSRRRQ